MRGVDGGVSLLGITASGDVGFVDAVQQSLHLLTLTSEVAACSRDHGSWRTYGGRG